MSQTGIQAADQAFIERSACLVRGSWFDADGNPYLPQLVSYRLDDVLSGENILPWTPIAPGTANTVTVSTAQNAMVNATAESETHQALFQITDLNGAVFYAAVQFEIVSTTGLN